MQLAPYRKDFITSDRFFNQPPDSTFDFTRLYKLHKKYPDNIMWEQFYKGALLMGIMVRNSTYGIMTGIGGSYAAFKVSPTERAIIDTLRDDFERLAATKQNHNKYFAYKTLGTIDLYRFDLKSSLKWYKKAIKHKKRNERTYEFNEAVIYSNMESVYLVMGDTMQAKKTLIKKIKIVPAINPLANDYVRMGYYNLLDKNITQAIVNFNTAIATDSLNAKAYTGLGMCHILQGNTVLAKQQLSNSIRIDRDYYLNSIIYGINSILMGDERTAYIMLNNAYTLVGEDKKNRNTINEIMLRFYGKDEY
jgi:tetratricopeptide (TPR) repeat protein